MRSEVTRTPGKGTLSVSFNNGPNYRYSRLTSTYAAKHDVRETYATACAVYIERLPRRMIAEGTVWAHEDIHLRA